MVGAIALARLEVLGEVATVRAGSFGAVDAAAVDAVGRVLGRGRRSLSSVAIWSDGLGWARRWRAVRVLRRAAARSRRG